MPQFEEAVDAAADAVEALDHEVKFVLPATAAGPARLLLEGVCRAEAPHPRNRVGTIYFDDRALGSAQEKLASDYRKTKIRLRWYDGEGTAFLEVKRRVGSRREKLRLELPLAGSELERGGFAAAASPIVVAALAGAGIAGASELAPALRLAYDRERFVDPGSGDRLSLDSRLEALECAPWCDADDFEGDAAALDVAIVELKGGRRELPPALVALAALGARRGSFSKYSACFAALAAGAASSAGVAIFDRGV